MIKNRPFKLYELTKPIISTRASNYRLRNAGKKPLFADAWQMSGSGIINILSEADEHKTVDLFPLRIIYEELQFYANITLLIRAINSPSPIHITRYVDSLVEDYKKGMGWSRIDNEFEYVDGRFLWRADSRYCLELCAGKLFIVRVNSNMGVQRFDVDYE